METQKMIQGEGEKKNTFAFSHLSRLNNKAMVSFEVLAIIVSVEWYIVQILSSAFHVSNVNDVEPQQLSSELRLHGVLCLMRLIDD